VIGTSGNPNLWGFVLSCFGILALARVFFGRGMRFVPVLLGLVLALAMTGSRSAMLSFFVGSAATALLSMVFMRRTVAGLAIGVVATLSLPIIGVAVVSSLGSERFESGNISSLYKRFYVWQATIAEYQDDFLLGRGPAKSLRKRGFAGDASKFHVRDNNYVQTFAEFGIIGLGLLVSLFLAQFAHLWRLAPKVPIEERHWVLGGLGIVASWIVFNLSADAFNNVYLAHTQWIFYGSILAIGHQSVMEAQQAGDASIQSTDSHSEWGAPVYEAPTAALDGRI
jgi:O-antigen ligase